MASERADDFTGYERLDLAQECLNGGDPKASIAFALIDIAYSLKGIRQDLDSMAQQPARR